MPVHRSSRTKNRGTGSNPKADRASQKQESPGSGSKVPPGALLAEDFISEELEKNILQCLEKYEWSQDLSRRTLQFGYRYDHLKRQLFRCKQRRTAFPKAVQEVADMAAAFVQPEAPPKFDQCIVNEYTEAQGISQHIDQTTCFGETIVSVSLLSPVLFDFKKAPGASAPTSKGADACSVLMDRRSLLAMTGEARYNWTHGIKKEEEFTFNGKRYSRDKRISLTFRTVIPEAVVA